MTCQRDLIQVACRGRAVRQKAVASRASAWLTTAVSLPPACQQCPWSTAGGCGNRDASATRDSRAARNREPQKGDAMRRSEEHTSELQSLMRIPYAVFCLKKKTKIT